MPEICDTKLVDLQENGIIRDSDGKIIGKLITHDRYNEVCEKASDTIDLLRKTLLKIESSGLQNGTGYLTIKDTKWFQEEARKLLEEK